MSLAVNADVMTANRLRMRIRIEGNHAMQDGETSRLLKRVRQGVVIGVYATLCVAPMWAAYVVWSALSLGIEGFSGTDEFTGFSGRKAKERLQNGWPSNVQSDAVNSVSRKSNYSRDSDSTWTRIELSPEAAAAWVEHAHRGQEQYSLRRSESNERVEGVDRVVGKIPPTHGRTGEPPDWWAPPALEFRATEAMLWYEDFRSGVARCTYSAFDKTTSSIWIYEYSSQHERLWKPGEVPDGEQFSSVDLLTPRPQDIPKAKAMLVHLGLYSMKFDDSDRVVHLDLSERDAVTDHTLRVVRHLPHLKEFYAIYCPIRGDGLVHFASLKQLEVLDLYATLVDDRAMIHISKLHSLKSLNVIPFWDPSDTPAVDEVFTPMTDTGLSLICKLENLETLRIAGKITDEGLRNLVRLKKLKVLELNSPCLTDAGRQWVTETLPNVEVTLYPE